MSFFLLSDTEYMNDDLRNQLQSEIADRGNTIAYISSEPQEDPLVWFQKTAAEYHAIDNTIALEYFDLKKGYDEKGILEHSVIHLSGGNTYAFLQSIQMRNFGDILKKHIEKNGLIIGVSAGSVILTPSITTASLGENRDENNVNLQDLTGLGLVDFEFYPHFAGTSREIEELEYYSTKTPNPIFVCDDANGVFVRNGKITILNSAMRFQNGSQNLIDFE